MCEEFLRKCKKANFFKLTLLSLQAQTELGVLYTEDEQKDLKKAASLFKMAAEQKVWGLYVC